MIGKSRAGTGFNHGVLMSSELDSAPSLKSAFYEGSDTLSSRWWQRWLPAGVSLVSVAHRHTFLKPPAKSWSWLPLVRQTGLAVCLLSPKSATWAKRLQDHLGQTWVKWPHWVPGMDQPKPPSNLHPNLQTEGGSKVVLHGDTKLSKIHMCIYSHSRRCRRVWFLRLPNQGLK